MLLDKVLHNEVSKVVILYEGRPTRFGFETLGRVFEEIRKERIYRNSKIWNRRMARTGWRGS